MKLEICANSFQSALHAEEAGAHRIELCSELQLGGITPSYGVLKLVAENINIPSFVLIRPRSGDFNFSPIEYKIMKENILLCKELGFSGIVSGVLNSDNTIHVERTKALIELSRPLSFTFHRAFDITPDPYKAIEQLIDLGVDRVLTSGQKNTAEEGLVLLKDLHEKYGDKITILAGSGINANNVELFKEIGLTEVHTSATKK
ncbi:copper homeostasis protein CutC [Tenacibaculum jejuense]|uniref:PF03932 family protein CutC n=1 Tax=Tenacibaculum jejuense TaxID=584609 RepID=A0A238U8Q5_9FLAO|nr:copper homeostasis protein CutC [Tenacibaculum jejuense]SNR15547.1 Copper homeostasis protein CutC [Tenacibaculum jejuense]